MLRSIGCAVALLLPACGSVGGRGGGADAAAGVCYGPSGWQVCLDAKASGQVPLQGTLDTDQSDAGNPCLNSQPASWTATQPDACIVVGDTIAVTSLRATGTRPLVLVAQTQITVMGRLDVASHRSPASVGAGTGSLLDCTSFGRSPDSGPPGAGGAGGSFLFPGGAGGTGDGTNRPGGQPAGGTAAAPARLRGGCAGQPGGGGAAADGGAGGGSVYLVSAGTIAISGIIDASGGGGGGEDGLHGGGGGGSGGMIVLFASAITTTEPTLLIADGGGGGGGSALSGAMMKGQDGHEPMVAIPIQPALGGTGGLLVGATGGDGGRGYPALSNTSPGLSGVAGDTGAGGGGGGGGGGYIRSSQALGTAVVSPAADLVTR
ncbi:MAG TPA: hypothetical protein VHW23_04095 [Kofleriaceae bacterium]|nr:hypothetical protein [Kofleriaceae bacterium]